MHRRKTTAVNKTKSGVTPVLEHTQAPAQVTRNIVPPALRYGWGEAFVEAGRKGSDPEWIAFFGASEWDEKEWVWEQASSVTPAQAGIQTASDIV